MGAKTTTCHALISSKLDVTKPCNQTSNIYDSEENLRGGARYLALQIGRFNDIRLALAACNSGPNRVARLGRVPNISETQIFVRDGIDCYLALTAGRGIRNRSQCRTNGGR
jgi:hypothetical protein